MEFFKLLPQVLICGASAASLAACSSETSNSNSTAVPAVPNVSVSSVPDQPQLSRLDLAQEALMDGKTISLDLNNCPFDDSTWKGASDPLGGIQCNNVYKVSYNRETGEWTGVGFDEYRFATTGENLIKTFTRVHPEPKPGAVLLWGGTYILLEDGKFAMPRTSTDPQRVLGTYSF